ncbi:unnamed protein product, partial [Musa banksii]
MQQTCCRSCRRILMFHGVPDGSRDPDCTSMGRQTLSHGLPLSCRWRTLNEATRRCFGIPRLTQQPSSRQAAAASAERRAAVNSHFLDSASLVACLVASFVV